MKPTIPLIKLIIFDLDGVLIETKKIHFDALNDALKEENESFIINESDHLSVFDGLKTEQKLKILTETRGLPLDLHKKIWERKQEITSQKLAKLDNNDYLINLFKKLKDSGFKLACCSNSIKKTVLIILSKLGVLEFFDLILSNEDVKNSKPHPEIYWKAMSVFSVLPENTLILEDSPYGLKSAYTSNANVLRIKNPSDVTLENILKSIYNTKNMKIKWKDEKLNILIPMAGAGSRFEKAGYTFPKPLIEVYNKPMIQIVVENLNIDANYIFIVQKTHCEKYNLKNLLSLIAPNCKIIETDGITEGAACTTLLAKDYIDNDNPLIIVNSDQYIEWDSNEFMYKMQEQNVDAALLTFESTHPKWSFAKIDSNGYVTEVAEKNPISNIASVGLYYWKAGKDYVKYTEQMIDKNIRVNNEFYVCPVFNEAVLDNKKIKTFNIEKMWGLGTPEDLDIFLKNNKSV